MTSSASSTPTSNSLRKYKVHLLLLLVAVAVSIAYSKIYDPAAKIKPEDIQTNMVAPTLDGTHPCVYTEITSQAASPTIGRCMTPTNRSGATDRFEVDLRYGAFILRQSDLLLRDVFDIPLTRSYDSSEWFALSKTHAFGINSNHPFDVAPLGTTRPYTRMWLALEDGDVLDFKRISPGVDATDAVYLHTETSTRYYGSTIAWNGDGWTLRLVDGSTVRYPEAYKASSLAKGASVQMTDASGNKLELERDRQRNLTRIVTPNGHYIKFTYDDQARITKASDDLSTTVDYAYNGDGMLVSAISSRGIERHYEYDGQRMKAITDGRGRTLIRNTYTAGVLTKQEYENGDVYTYSYEWTANRRYATSVTITLKDGTQQIISTVDSVPHFLRPV